jgi:uncharacterized protein YdhG (YjbR/CyaY superfamily)
MATTAFQSVDEYLAAQPETSRQLLDQVRAAIRGALPGAEEFISYQMPAYRLHGRVVIYFAGWKKHFSIYPVGAYLLQAAGAGTERYDVNDKGTVRFPLDRPVPRELIARIAELRAAEVAEEVRAKAARLSRR